MRIAIILILLLAATFIPASAESHKIISLVDPYRAEGYVAFVANSEESDKKEKDKEVVACTCGGTGIMVHGDGHKTNCICKATGECKCGKNITPAPIPPSPPKPEVAGLNRKVLLLFTADWCQPCNRVKRQLPEYVKRSMTYSDIGDKLETKMEIVDIDQNPELYDKIKGDRKAIPLFIMLDKDNNEVASFIGYQNCDTIIRSWNGY